MKSLYESILKSVGAGKDMLFEPQFDRDFGGNLYYNIKLCTMKEWFKSVSPEKFYELVKGPITRVRKDYNDYFTVSKMLCLTFKDGVFVIYFMNPNKRISFEFYFADKMCNDYPDYKTLLIKQKKAIDNDEKINFFEKGLIVKKCAKQLLEFIKNNLDKIIKQ